VRVVLVTSLERGGPLEHSLLLARGLTECGVRVHAICASEVIARRFESSGAEPRTIPLRRPFDPLQAVRIYREASGGDVVHAQDRRSGLWVRLGPRPRPGGLRVYTTHGLPEPYLPSPVGPKRPGIRALLAYRCLDAALCRRADAVIVPSRASAEILVRRVGYPQSSVHIVPNGVVAPPPRPAEVGSLVGTLSVLEPVKGLEVFMRAAARLADRRRDLHFAMFGTGSQAEELVALASDLGLAERLDHPGQVAPAEALSRLRVFVLSSYWETMPLSLLEAMAAGVPVVATRVGGIPEVAVDGTAQLVEPGDELALAEAIERLLDDPELARRQAEAARDRVSSSFSAAAVARSTLELYESLLRARP
jgi:glycosyltransferase involved in cell wall biosynthesis